MAALLAVALLAPTPSAAQCGADPTQTAIGIEMKSDAKGPPIPGLLSVEFLDTDGFTSNGARLVFRARRGSQLETFYAESDAIFDIATPNDTQVELVAVLRGPVLGAFFGDVCGNDGSLCPDPDVCGADGALCPGDCGVDGSLCTPVGVVLKQLEEFAVTLDNRIPRSQYLTADVVMATTEPL